MDFYQFEVYRRHCRQCVTRGYFFKCYKMFVFTVRYQHLPNDLNLLNVEDMTKKWYDVQPFPCGSRGEKIKQSIICPSWQLFGVPNECKRDKCCTSDWQVAWCRYSGSSHPVMCSPPNPPNLSPGRESSHIWGWRKTNVENKENTKSIIYYSYCCQSYRLGRWHYSVKYYVNFVIKVQSPRHKHPGIHIYLCWFKPLLNSHKHVHRGIVMKCPAGYSRDYKKF